MPANIAVWTTAMTSPASAPIMVKPRMWSLPASTSAFMKPRVSDIVRDRNTAAIGSFATRTAMPWRWASLSLKPTRASGGAGDIEVGNNPQRLGGFPPPKFAEKVAAKVEQKLVEMGAAAAL